MKRKAQAAMEYLMTYGWAILIVIIVAAALYALGVFDPATWTGSTATGFRMIGTPDQGAWRLGSNGNFDLKLTNRISSRINVTEVNISIGTDTQSASINLAPYDEVSLGGAIDLNTTMTGSFQSGAAYTATVLITYTNIGSGLDFKETGTLTGSVS
jgi:hypothetical protein